MMLTILIDIATVLVCALAVGGCGQEQAQVAPAPAPDATVAAANANAPVADPVDPAPTATPNPTVATYIYQNINICTDLHTWAPAQVTIKTYPNSGNSDSLYYLLRWDGAFIVGGGGCENGCAAPDADLVRSDINGTVCTIHLRNGQYAGVTP